MDKEAVKELLFGAVLELTRHSKYYYHSSIGPQYSRLTEEGKLALYDYMELMIYKIKEAEEAELTKRAEQQTLNILKKKEI